MDRQRFLIPTLALITMWRLALLPTMELSPDEGLALFYARHLQMSYLEMGPLVPLLVKWSTWFFGAGELGVRLLAPLLALVTSVCLWRLCRGVFDAGTAAWSVVALQMVPAFNVAAISMTSSIVSLTALTVFVLALRQALHRVATWDRMWLIAGVCLLLAILADWRNLMAYLCAVAALALTGRRRHHIFSPGFALVTLGAIIGLGLFVEWNIGLQWPSWEAGELEPVWQVWPNVLRWLLLASPVMLWLLVRAIRTQLGQWRKLGNNEVLLIAFAVPYAVLDFGWGPRERWPDTGFLLWIVLGIAMVANQSMAVSRGTIQRKVMVRSVTLLLAALQSMILMRTDMLRRVGLPWALQKHANSTRTWQSFMVADPSSSMMGWKQGAELLDKVVFAAAQKGESPWFVIARDWPLAVMCDAYLPPDAPVWQPTPEHPRIQVVEQPEREHPLATLPRYDAMQDGKAVFAGHHALYITDLATAASPPAAIRRAFDRWDAVSVVRVMHAGQEVRTLKIFACYGYKPPDL